MVSKGLTDIQCAQVFTFLNQLFEPKMKEYLQLSSTMPLQQTPTSFIFITLKGGGDRSILFYVNLLCHQDKIKGISLFISLPSCSRVNFIFVKEKM